MGEQFSGYKRVWKWYDEIQNGWTPYPSANNRIIDDAFKKGKPQLKLLFRVNITHYHLIQCFK